MKTFVAYTALLDGDEKGEAQVFCDRLFQAFGHEGYKEAGAILEYRIKRKGQPGTSFADLVWAGRALIEMKKRGEKLRVHYQQAFTYWLNAVPNRPRYVVLCNFDEFWIYDFERQLDTPVDQVRVEDLPKRYTALNFLFPENPAPHFGQDREAVSRAAADHVASVFHSLTERGEDRAKAQRFILQIVVAMFAEDMDLLPSGIVHELIVECQKGASSYDAFGALFRQMNSKTPAKAGRFKNVAYFNGGIYSDIDPAELTRAELDILADVAAKDWAKVNPAIFGTLFQASMDKGARHALGAHFTSEGDILKVVDPTIIRPWRERIETATTMRELLALRAAMLQFRVLDPSCGSGNFLYVAFRVLVRLEIALLAKLADTVSAKEFAKQVKGISLISPRQFFGIDVDSFAIELAKVTLMLAKKLAIDEAHESLEREQIDIDLYQDHALPLDNLDANFQCTDALFTAWPEADAIVSNPPYQSKNKMQAEYGRAYLNRLREAYPNVPGRADYCVFWFRRAHDHLANGQRAGMVGTNSIRQNYSREGGLDYIVANGGTITEAVSSQVWSGDAAVHVSIVNWTKGPVAGPKLLSRQVGDAHDSPWEFKHVPVIDPALSFNESDITAAKVLKAYAQAGGCYQGQTHGHEGFLMTVAEARALLKKHPAYRDVLFPYLTADEMLGDPRGLPSRYVIDFGTRDKLEAQEYAELYARIAETVLPSRQQRADEEAKRNAEARAANPKAKVTLDHANALAQWWLLFRRRGEMLKAIGALPRYVACGRVTKRPIFDFVSPAIHPNDAMMVFPYADDYSFGILQSGIHAAWFRERGSSLKGDARYTSNTVFDTFAWPQSPTAAQVTEVAAAAVDLRKLRRGLQMKHGLTLRELYRTLEEKGKHPLRDAQEALDAVVRKAYGMKPKEDVLGFLLKLNSKVADAEAAGSTVTGPGRPAVVKSALVTKDCIHMP